MDRNYFEDIFALISKDDIISAPRRLIPMMMDVRFERADILSMRTFVGECPKMLVALLEGRDDPSIISEVAAARTGVDPGRLGTLLNGLVSAASVSAPGCKPKPKTSTGDTPYRALAYNSSLSGESPTNAEGGLLGPPTHYVTPNPCSATGEITRNPHLVDYDAKEHLRLGIGLKGLKDAGFTADELKNAGFTADELKNAGFSVTELMNAGFGFQELKLI